MGRAGVFAVLVAAMVGGTGAGAGVAGPPAALVQAVRHTNAAASVNVSFVEQVMVGSDRATVQLRGIEEPKAKAGSFVFSLSPAQPGLGQATELITGARVYVHYPLLDRLHAKNPAVKPWLLIDSRSSLGVDPAGLTALGTSELNKMIGFKIVGRGTDAGVPVTRYEGLLSLREASSLPQFQALLAHLPSAGGFVLRSSAHVVFSVGSDGYVHRVQTTIATLGNQKPTVQIAITAILTNFNQNASALVPPPASEVMTLAAFNRMVGAPAPANSGALLTKVVLKGSQVGAGYVLGQIPGGQLVQGEATLDYCGMNYPSEALRTGRLQVQYTKKGAVYKASNEVVSYGPGGAGQALAEARHAAATCPQGPLNTAPAGVTNLVHHSSLITDPHLLPGAVAILDHDTALVHGKKTTINSMEVYQARGNILSGVYATGGTPAAVKAATLHAAEQSAGNLRRLVPASAH